MSRRIANRQARKAREKEEAPDSDLEEEFDSLALAASLPSSSPNSLSPSTIIELFRDSFRALLESESLQEQIQAVKKELYNRQYLAAFDTDDKRFAYVSRWTPPRALCYASLFGSLPPIKNLLKQVDEDINVLCIGGGAGAELVGLVSVFSKLKESHIKYKSNLNIDIIDIADWSKVINTLEKSLIKGWNDKFTINTINDDILTMSPSKLNYGKLDLITLFFTTNELFSEKRKESMMFLKNLNKDCATGCYLLIAESAGSYSHITIGTKKFPIQFLIDTILIGKPDEKDGPWELLEESESCWYRVNQREVTYDMKLENMRFFYRLYKKK